MKIRANTGVKGLAKSVDDAATKIFREWETLLRENNWRIPAYSALGSRVSRLHRHWSDLEDVSRHLHRLAGLEFTDLQSRREKVKG